MKRKLIKRNKLKLSLYFKIPDVIRTLKKDPGFIFYNGRNRKKYFIKADMPKSTRFLNSFVSVPNVLVPKNKKSRLSGYVVSYRLLKIDAFNELFDTNLTLDDFPED